MNNILFFSHNLNLEGAPIFLFNLAKEFKKNGWTVSLISPSKGPLKKRYDEENISVLLPNRPITEGIDSNQMIQYIEYVLKTKKFEHFFINSIILYKVIETALNKGIKPNWIIHESEIDAYLKEYPAMDPFLLSRTKRTIFVSEATKNIYQKYLNNKGTVINNGVELEAIKRFEKNNKKKDLLKEFNISPNQKNIIFPGTTCLRKGQIDAIKGLSYIKDFMKENQCKIYFIGGRDSTYLSDMNYLTRLLDLNNFIKIIPETPYIYKYYSIADIFVNLSYIESLPITIMEAMAFKLPIIASNIYGIPELVSHEKEAILVNPGNKIQFISALKDIITNTKKAKFLAHNAYKKVKTSFTTDIMYQKYSQLLKN